MKNYKGFKIPEKSDLNKEGIVVSFGDDLYVKLSKPDDDKIFDTGISPTEVYNMTEEAVNNLIFSRASGYIDTLI